jgi:hypothetical protein
MTMRRSLNGALAGAVAAAVWAAQQPLDRHLFESAYDDVELLGKLLTRERGWALAGTALHVANGAAFGAAYAQVRPFLPVPGALSGVLAALAENFATWPLAALVDRHHPARGELARLAGNRRALAQATWRHALFGALLGLLEDRLNADPGAEPPRVPVGSNGHGDLSVPETVVART